MAQDQVGNIKLVSMEIVDFKTLPTGNINWNVPVDGHFGIIAVQDFVDRTTMFQAFQFGFGHDTDARNAEVIVVLQRQIDDHVDTLKFKHSKKLLGHQTVTKFGIQTMGVDNGFQDVDQNQYFEKLADLKIFALNQVFLMQGNSQEVLASDSIDLRPFLEMYLLDKPHQDSNYDRENELVETLFERKKGIQLHVKYVKKSRTNYELESENQQKAFKAESSEKDARLLQMFYHERREESGDFVVPEVEPALGNLKEDLGRVDGDIEGESLRNQMQNRSEANVNSWNTFLEEKENEIERQLESIVNDVASLNSTSSNVLNRLATALSEGKCDVLDAEIKAENARFKLTLAELDQQISAITEEWETLQKPAEEMTEVKEGRDLIGMNPIENELSKNLDGLKNDVEDAIEQDSLFHGQHEFHVPEMSEEDFREFMTKLPKSGQIVLSTIFEMDDTITKVLEDDAIVGGRFIMIHLKDPNSNLKLDPFFTGITVTGEPDPDDFDDFGIMPNTEKLQEKLDKFEKNDSRDLRELAEKIAEKEYIVPKVLENNPNVVQTGGDQIENLKKELVEAQAELSTLYQTKYGDLSHGLGFPSADSAVNFCNAFAHLGVSTDQSVNDVIGDLNAMKNQLQQQHQQLQQHKAESLLSQGTRIDRMTWEELLVHGKLIAESVNKFFYDECKYFISQFEEAKYANTNSAILHNKALFQIYELVKDWDLPFDSEHEQPTEVYLDCISDQYKQGLNLDTPIEEVFAIVGKHVMEINQAIAEFKHKNDRIHAGNKEVDDLQKNLERAQKNINKLAVAQYGENKKRAEVFEPMFKEFLKHFVSLVNDCSSDWHMHVSLVHAEGLSALREPILLLVSDPTLDQSYNEMTGLNHHAAAIVLKLAINLTIKSPILIFDSIDYIVEERLKNPIMKLLKKLVNGHGIQVFFMMVKSQEDLPAGNVHQVWSQMNPQSQMMEDHVADITDLAHRPAE